MRVFAHVGCWFVVTNRFGEGLILEDGSDVQSRNICNYQELLPSIP